MIVVVNLFRDFQQKREVPCGEKLFLIPQIIYLCCGAFNTKAFAQVAQLYIFKKLVKREVESEKKIHNRQKPCTKSMTRQRTNRKIKPCEPSEVMDLPQVPKA
jgi:hypothetical protein